MEKNNQDQQVNPSVTTPQTQPTAKSISKNYYSVIIAAIVVLLLLVGGAYYLGVNKGQSKYQTSIQTTPIPITINPTTTPSTETETWKSYTKVDFSIKYPTNFYLDVTGRGADYMGDNKTSIDKYLSGQTLQTNQIVITLLSLAEHFDQNNLQALANRVAGGTQQNIPYTNVNVSGVKAVKVVYNNVENYGIPTQDGFVWI